MPQPNYPPFAAGAVSVPRQLIRWLDINPQGGSLERTQAFITVPAFSVNYTWRGYSDIVASFNYEGANNFSLTSLFGELPSSPNYTLCISYIDSSNVVHRYSLVRGVNDLIYESITPYSGQLIQKNFRIEVWSTSAATSSQATALILYTTVKGGVDYRYGNDFNLVSSDAICTSFGDNSQATVTFPTNSLVAHWRADTNFVVGVYWNDTVSGQVLTVSGPTQATPAGLNGQKAIDLSVGTLSGSGIINSPLTFASGTLFLVYAQKSAGSGATFFQIADNTSTNVISVASTSALGKIQVNGTNITDGTATSYPTFRVALIDYEAVLLYNFNGVLLDIEYPSGGSTNNITKLNTTASPVYLAEIFFYSALVNQNDIAQFYRYLTQRYAGANQFLLPFTFPSNSVSQPNIKISTNYNTNPGNYTGPAGFVN